MEKWAADIVATLKMNKITQRKLAEQMNITEEYLSSILNGKRTSTSDIEERIQAAIKEILEMEE